MSSVNINKVIDGERNLVLNVNLQCDDGNCALQPLVDFSTVSQPRDNTYTKCRCDQIEYDVADNLTVRLWWEGATSNAPLWRLYGRGRIPAWAHDYIPNTADSPTGNVLIETSGWSPSTGPLTASFIITFVKQL